MEKIKSNKKLIIGIIVIVLIIIACVAGFLIYNDSKENEISAENIEFVSQYFDLDIIETEDDFLSSQDSSNELIDLAISNSNSLSEADVIINPYGNSPLTAVIVFETSTSEEVTLEMYGETYSFESSTSHVIPVYGLISGEITTVTITAGSETKSFDFDMSDVVFDIDIDVLVNEGTLSDGVYLFTNPMEGGAYAINESGQVIWHLDCDYTLTPVVLDNGHLLLSSSDFSTDLYSRNGIIEIDYLGKIYNYYEVEGGYHHDIELLPNGNLLVASSNLESDTNLDSIIEIDLTTGETVKLIDFNSIISKIDSSVVDGEDWLFNNGIYYDETTNSVLISTRMQNSVISVDYDTLELNWIFGNPVYWTDAFNDYLIEFDGNYPLGMHSVEINSDGNLVMFNNNYDKSNAQISSYYDDFNSSGVIYNLDLDNMTASLVSEFDDNESFFSYAVSTYKELDNGNYLLMSGWEIDSSKFNDLDELNDFYNGNTTTLYELDSDNNILFKATISNSSYAGTKTTFYQEGENSNIDISDLEYYENYDKYSYTEIDIEDIKTELTNAEDFSHSYSLTDNVFSIQAGFADTDVVNLYLVKEDATVYKYTLKEENETLIYYLDIKDVVGEFALFVEVNGEFYNYNVVYNFR